LTALPGGQYSGENEDSMKRFDVGDRVMEPTYGHGNVVSVEDDYIRIEFDEHGTKKFLLSLAKLERSSEPGARKKKKTTKKKAAAAAEPVEA
jgi:preprotein translocase subunit YajC